MGDAAGQPSYKRYDLFVSADRGEWAELLSPVGSGYGLMVCTIAPEKLELGEWSSYSSRRMLDTAYRDSTFEMPVLVPAVVKWEAVEAGPALYGTGETLQGPPVIITDGEWADGGGVGLFDATIAAANLTFLAKDWNPEWEDTEKEEMQGVAACWQLIPITPEVAHNIRSWLSSQVSTHRLWHLALPESHLYSLWQDEEAEANAAWDAIRNRDDPQDVEIRPKPMAGCHCPWVNITYTTQYPPVCYDHSCGYASDQYCIDPNCEGEEAGHVHRMGHFHEVQEYLVKACSEGGCECEWDLYAEVCSCGNDKPTEQQLHEAAAEILCTHYSQETHRLLLPQEYHELWAYAVDRYHAGLEVIATNADDTNISYEQKVVSTCCISSWQQLSPYSGTGSLETHRQLLSKTSTDSARPLAS